MPGSSLKIANIADGVLVDATYTYGSVKIDKRGTQYTITETLKEDMNMGGYKVLSGAIKKQTLAEGGDSRTVITGIFEKDGIKYYGTLTKQGNSDWVFAQGKRGEDFETILKDTEKIAYGPQYGDNTVVNSLMAQNYQVLDGLIKYNPTKGFDLDEIRSMLIAGNIADTFGKYIKHLGENDGVTNTNFGGSISMKEGAAANLGIFLATLGSFDFDVEGRIGVNIGNVSSEKEIADLWSRYFLVLEKSAFKFAQDKVNSLGIDNEQEKQKVFTETFNKAFGSLVSSSYENLQNALINSDPALYGKSHAFGGIKVLLEKFGWKNEDIENLTNVLKNELDSTFKKPQPSATQSNNFQPSNNDTMLMP